MLTLKSPLLIFLCVFSLVLIDVHAKSIYNTKKSYITPINKLNFEAQVTKTRETTKNIIIIQYYKFNGKFFLINLRIFVFSYIICLFLDGESKRFATEFDEFTNEFRGVFKIGSCDCEEDSAICEKEKITKFPTFRIYPPIPIPAFDYEVYLNKFLL